MHEERAIAPSSGISFVESVVHPTDLSYASEAAFAHALAISLIRRTSLHILHVGHDAPEGWSSFPEVRKTLVRWGLLEPDSDRSAVFDELEVRVKKVRLQGDPVRRTLDYLYKHDPDLLVLATEGRQGLARWLEPSIAQSIARRSRTMTLFVGRDGHGFVSPKDGHLTVRRILVPIDWSPDATDALVKAARIGEALGDTPVEISLLHVGEGAHPDLARPDGDACIWHEIRRSGRVDDQILEVAASIDADLIVMATNGRDGVLDALRGSFTERVVRRAHCPVLAVPATV